jgi:hypothetical protein
MPFPFAWEYCPNVKLRMRSALGHMCDINFENARYDEEIKRLLLKKYLPHRLELKTNEPERTNPEEDVQNEGTAASQYRANKNPQGSDLSCILAGMDLGHPCRDICSDITHF